jgi:DNA-binding MarR family transcriptional regulator
MTVAESILAHLATPEHVRALPDHELAYLVKRADPDTVLRLVRGVLGPTLHLQSTIQEAVEAVAPLVQTKTFVSPARDLDDVGVVAEIVGPTKPLVCATDPRSAEPAPSVAPPPSSDAPPTGVRSGRGPIPVVQERVLAALRTANGPVPAKTLRDLVGIGTKSLHNACYQLAQKKLIERIPGDGWALASQPAPAPEPAPEERPGAHPTYGRRRARPTHVARVLRLIESSKSQISLKDLEKKSGLSQCVVTRATNELAASGRIRRIEHRTERGRPVFCEAVR